MKANIDFLLSEKKFGVVEQTIFRLVSGGVKDVNIIVFLLSIYREDVIANSIKKLVNSQILSADLDNCTLDISEPILTIMESCINQNNHLEFPFKTEENVLDNSCFITGRNEKQQILNCLLPEFNTGFLIDSLDFVIYSREGQNE